MSGFVDECQLNVRAGDGGAGCVSTRREAHVPLGGPDGGDGGDGGSVWLVADRNVSSLLAFRDHPHRRAPSGTHGQGKKRHGARGDDLLVSVPEGTEIHDEHGVLVADLVSPGDRWLAAAGGQGGRGNARFLSNRRRAPSFAEQGERGQEQWLRLELKLMADVALVGYPNVGKSTLISRLSAAKPKIADYPFTTLEPNLGVVRASEGRDFVVADIPGVIEGAAQGKGLGHQFLRHIERARVLAVLVDLADVAGQADPATQLDVLLGELRQYRPDLVDRPRVVIGSRSDVAAGDLSPGLDVGIDLDLRISAVTGEGLPQLVGRLADEVHQARLDEPVPETFIVHRPVTQDFVVERSDDGGYKVVGRPAERAVALSDLTNPDALDFAHHRLKRLGVDQALARAGAHEGDLVHIAGHTFTFEPDGA